MYGIKQEQEQEQETRRISNEYVEFESKQVKNELEENTDDNKQNCNQYFDDKISKKRKIVCRELVSIASNTKVKEEVIFTATHFEKEILSKDKVILDLQEQLFNKEKLVQELQTTIRTNYHLNRVSNETANMVSLNLRRNKQEVFRLSQENKILETKNKELLISRSLNPDQKVSRLNEEKYILELKIKVFEETLKQTEKQSMAIQEEVFKHELKRNKQEVQRLSLENSSLHTKMQEVLNRHIENPNQEVLRLSKETNILELHIKDVKNTLKLPENESLAFQEEVFRLKQELPNIKQKDKS